MARNTIIPISVAKPVSPLAARLLNRACTASATVIAPYASVMRRIRFPRICHAMAKETVVGSVNHSAPIPRLYVSHGPPRNRKPLRAVAKTDMAMTKMPRLFPAMKKSAALLVRFMAQTPIANTIMK